MTIALTGKMSGTADKHTADSLKASFENAWFAAARSAFEGKLSDAPENLPAAPILLFAHGSSGIGAPLKAFARFVSSLGWSFLAPDSFVVPDRITYSSPVSRENYERVHAMRSQELDYAARHLDEAPGFSGRYAVAGTSEGGVAAARFTAPEGRRETGRILFSWPCEDNYHVVVHQTHIPDDVPVLNIMSAEDKYFSRANPWLDNPDALGHAGRTLARHPQTSILLIPGAPHTLFALPQTESAVRAFLERI